MNKVWINRDKVATQLKRNIKNINNISNLKDCLDEPGMFIDNLNGNKVNISECKESTLRRYIKKLNDYYFLITDMNDREKILNKKREIETELDSRESDSK